MVVVTCVDYVLVDFLEFVGVSFQKGFRIRTVLRWSFTILCV